MAAYWVLDKNRYMLGDWGKGRDQPTGPPWPPWDTCSSGTLGSLFWDALPPCCTGESGVDTNNPQAETAVLVNDPWAEKGKPKARPMRESSLVSVGGLNPSAAQDTAGTAFPGHGQWPGPQWSGEPALHA